jgi:hypothetical protein
MAELARAMERHHNLGSHMQVTVDVLVRNAAKNEVEKRATQLEHVQQWKQNLLFQVQVNVKVQTYEPRITALEGTHSQQTTTNANTQDVTQT